MLRFKLILILMLTVAMPFFNVDDVFAQQAAGRSIGSPPSRGGHSGISGIRAGRFGNSGFGRRIGTGSGRPYSWNMPSERRRGYGPAYSRHRSDGSSFGIYVGGADPYLAGGSGSLPSGYARYNTAAPYGYFVPDGYRVPFVAPGVPSIGDPVSPLPIAENTTGHGRLPKNVLPSVSVVTEEVPRIERPGTVVLFNPTESGGPVRYLLNGRDYVIHPGEAQTLAMNQAWIVEFDRGMDGAIARATIAEGIHKFVVGQLGWELVPAQASRQAEMRMTPTFPPAPMPVESFDRKDDQELLPGH